MYVKIYDKYGRAKFPVALLKKMKIRAGERLLIIKAEGDTIILKKTDKELKALKNMGPKLPAGIDEEKVLKDIDLLIL